MTTDLKPGDLVQHPEHGYGVVLKNFPGVPTIYFADKHGYENTTRHFTGWERVETLPKGHVAVRVDDLDPQTLSEWSQYAGCDLVETALLRVGSASIARQVGQDDPSPHWPAESTPPADEPERAEKPTSTTVTLPCPKCGEEIVNQVVVRLDSDTLNGGYYLAFDGEYPVTNHRCQPDEPQGFGARVTVTLPDGVREKWLRQPSRWWVSEWGGESMWRYLIERGTVTLGWESE